MTSRPGDVLGLHFFNPANLMKLVELVRGTQTTPEVLATALALCKKMKKIVVVAEVCDGFIGNRMVEQYIRQAQFLVEEGASPSQVDQALEGFGMAMGPFRMLDIVGNDVPWEVRKRRRVEMPGMKYPTIPDEICERGWFGQKTGMGWYAHEKGVRRPLPNPDLPAVIKAHSASLGLVRRKIDDEEIVSRCILALANEGVAILAEGIAQRASDIDVVYLAGYGFPRGKGGPMFHADRLGLLAVARQMRRFARNPHGDPAFWQPHPLLLEQARKGLSLSSIGEAS
jgi:3-hydroxyacyl-CoA dehydrogenase